MTVCNLQRHSGVAITAVLLSQQGTLAYFKKLNLYIFYCTDICIPLVSLMSFYAPFGNRFFLACSQVKSRYFCWVSLLTVLNTYVVKFK
jgi:hypothetical protein